MKLSAVALRPALSETNRSDPFCVSRSQFPEEKGLVRAKLLTSGYYGRVRKEDPDTTRVYYMIQVGCACGTIAVPCSCGFTAFPRGNKL